MARVLTVEAGLYGLLALLGLALRLWDLGGMPLSQAEAEVAYQAWLTYQGLGGSPVGHSPLLFNLLLFLYWVFGASDTVTRLVPAIAGAVLVLLPALLRPQLGRLGALFVASYMALSPSLVMASRQAWGESLALLGTLATLALAWRYVGSRRPGELYLAAGALAVALLSSWATYLSLAIWASGLLGVVVLRRMRGEASAAGFQWGETHGRALLLLAGLLLLLSTGALALPAGLQAALELSPSPASSGAGLLELALSYEPAATLLGLIGLGMALLRPTAWSRFVSLWLLAGALLYPLGLGGATALPQLLLPLVLLSALPIEGLFSKAPSEELWVREGLFVLLALVGWVFLLLRGAAYARFEEGGALVGAGLALLYLLSLTAAFGVWKGWVRAARAFLLFTLLALGGFTARAGALLNQSVDPALGELLRPATTSADVRQLAADLEVASNLRTGQRHALEIALRVDDARLRWYLREFENVRLAGDSLSAAVITTLDQEPGGPDYLGQRYRLGYTWGPPEGGWADWLRWYLYREVEVPPRGWDVMLWLSPYEPRI